MKASPQQAERLHRFAHDLRNRLAALNQAAGELAGADADARAELLGFVEQQYFKAMRACEDLLDDMEVDRGVGELKRERIELGALVHSEIGKLSHRFERKEQPVTVTCSEPVFVHADPHWTGMLVGALLSNASKFSHPRQEISVSIGLHEGVARLDVRDSGIGLAADQLVQVFSRYALLRGKPTAGEAQGRSTLARARQWAEAHGGTLTATSDGEGRGACFTLRLPLSPPTGA